MYAIIKLDYPIVRDAYFRFLSEFVISEVTLRHVMMKDLIGIDLANVTVESIKIIIPRVSNLTRREVENLAVCDFIKIQDFVVKSFEPKKVRL